MLINQEEPLKEIVGDLVSQAQIRNTLFFIASSISDFANNIFKLV